MQCEQALGSLAAGESSPEVRAHVAGCPRCGSAVGLMRGGGVVRASPLAGPSIGGLRARERRRGLVRAAVAGLAVLVVAGVVALGGGSRGPGAVGGTIAAPAAQSRPPAELPAGLWDVLDGTTSEESDGLARILPRDPLRTSMIDEVVEPDPLRDLSDPTDLFDSAPRGEGSL